MAGKGPPPKTDPVRRNKKPGAEEVESDGGVLPLPATYTVAPGGGPVEVEFLDRTREWFELLVTSPEIKARLTVAGALRLHDLAVLQDGFFRSGSLELQKELRIGLAAFGATPADALRLGMTVKAKEPEKSKSAAAEKSNVRHLKAV